MEITDKNFEEITNKKIPTLIVFKAPWCAPCRMMAPIIEELTSEYFEKVIIGSVNVDENPVLSTKFKIRSIPTILLINEKGEVVEIIVGARPKSELSKKIETLITKV